MIHLPFFYHPLYLHCERPYCYCFEKRPGVAFDYIVNLLHDEIQLA